MKSTSLRLVAVLVSCALGGLALTACGSSSSSQTNSSSSDTTTRVASTSPAGGPFEFPLSVLYKGTYTAPVGTPFTPPRAKDVWVISTGQSVETSVNATTAMQQAAKLLGWHVTIVDGQFSSAKELQGVQQAIAAKAQGIIILYIDCAPIKAGLTQAKAAGIPVVGIEGQDCNPPLFSHVVAYAGNTPFLTWIKQWGAAQADYLIAKLNGKSNTIVSIETDLATTRLAGDGSMAEFSKCPGCHAVRLNFVGTDFGNPLQQKISESLLQNPSANSFLAAYDAVLTSGGAQALESSGRKLFIMGGEGSTPGIKMIHEGRGMNACIGIPTQMEGWSSMDAMARLLAHKSAGGTNSGIGIQACDATHNLPAAGLNYQPPVNLAEAYKKLWNQG